MTTMYLHFWHSGSCSLYFDKMSTQFFVILIILLCLQQQCLCHVGTLSDDNYSDKPLVYTRLGTVRGLRKTVLDFNVEVFLGIPYAKAPVGNLRFKKPQKVDPWIDVYEANKLSNSCEQTVLDVFTGFLGETQWNPNTELSEDCLYLNVWVPEWERDGRPHPQFDVVVWIYGGGFSTGTSTLDLYDGSYLASSNKVIVVSMNYRLGPFGFLYMGTGDAPGNVGLFDQALALQWIKENIDAFGGNSNSVTVLGESAGSAAVCAHILSPFSKGLFQRAVLQSGTMNMPWAFKQPEESLQLSYELSNLVGCSTSILKTKNDIVKCLRDVPAATITKAQEKLNMPVMGFPFVPTIDGELLPKDPSELMKTGDFRNISVLLGTVANEGTYFAVYDFTELLDKDMPSLITRSQASSMIKTTFDKSSSVERDLIHFMYTDWDHPWDGTKNRENMVMMIGDYFFTCPLIDFAKQLALKETEVYYYLFTHRTSNNPWGKWMGVLHGDEIDFFFGNPLDDKFGFTQEESQLSYRIMKHFTNFARTGNPSTKEVDWPLYTPSNPVYVDLNIKNYKTGIGPRSTECSFWNNLFPKIKQGSANVCKHQVLSTNAVSNYTRITDILLTIGIPLTLILINIFC